MELLDAVILDSGDNLIQRMKVIVEPEQRTKQDLLMLSNIDDIIRQSCYFDLLDDDSLNTLITISHKIINANPRIIHARYSLNDYRNLGKSQNTLTYARIDNTEFTVCSTLV